MRNPTSILALVLLLLCAAPASALTVVHDDATLTVLSGVQDFSSGGPIQSDTDIFLYQEQDDLTLASDLTVDAVGPGTYTSSSSTSVIGAGTAVHSFFFHMDVMWTTTHGGGGSTAGTVVFDFAILGIIGTTASLAASDAELAYAPTTYTPVPQSRGTWEAGDSLTILADGRTLVIDSLRVSNAQPYADQFRVITATTPAVTVPEPAFLALVLPFVVLAGRCVAGLG